MGLSEGKEKRGAISKILITGASGFIASHLIKALPQENLILLSRSEKLKTKYPKATFVQFSEEKIGELVVDSKPDVIVNLIGILVEKGNNTYEKVHFELTKRLVEAAKRVNLRKFIHISALGVRPNSRSRYHQSKWKAEEFIRSSGVPYAIFRPSIVLGEEQKLYEDLRFFSRFTPIIPAPKMKVQPVSVEKVVDSVRKAIYGDVTGTFELCGEKVMSMKELFELVLSELGIKRLVVEVPKVFFLPAALVGIGLTFDQYLMMEDNICR
ncbi:NAD-dependent epimerase/dehydratase family protein [Phorcysia thermohydrogeniphila]|uniref:NADH dehydrogenase n=1 Tax=Phorcysia thermohydrogeniphila TaxID=936138 RepID=A0A4R1GJV1_9BACT|nr:NAD-dependent epimerase/dehydratase family protein [Phorcysia thermohydrogeniphila]TCK06259.1 NADH dehydrogenase [Phorcysia thermohydrogeniphila]